MRLSANQASPEALVAARRAFRRSDPRRTIYRVPIERRRAFRDVMKHARVLVGDDPTAPEVLPVNTWQASTHHVESGLDEPAYIVYDFQTSNRLNYLSRSQLHGFDAFDAFLNLVAVFLELCVGTLRYDRARRTMDRFDAIRSELALSMIRAFAGRPRDRTFEAKEIWTDSTAYTDYFLQSFVLGHEIGHHLFAKLESNAQHVSQFYSAHYAVTHDAHESYSFEKHGYFEGEFVFAEGEVQKIRAFRDGESLANGLIRRLKRKNSRTDSKELQEFYSDTVGLVLGLHAVNEVGMLARLPSYWMCLYLSSVSQALLSYLAKDWRPVQDGVVPFLVPPAFERFALPIRLIGSVQDFDQLLPTLGWGHEGMRTVGRNVKHWSSSLEEWAEDVGELIRESLIYEVMRAFNGPIAAQASVHDPDFWAETERLGYADLFLPVDEREVRISDLLFGGQMGYRFILEALREEWEDDDGDRNRSMLSEEEQTAIADHVLRFRLGWRRYFTETVQRLKKGDIPR